MNIRLYCVNDLKRNAFKIRLEKALAQHHLPVEIDEICEMDDVVKDGIFSLPAIKIGDRIFLYDDRSAQETIEKVITYLRTGCEGNILVPVDFSPESTHALRYARMLATKFGKGITVAFVHQPYLYTVTAGEFDVKIMESSRKQLERMVVEIEKDNKAAGVNIPISAHFDIGEITSTLTQLAKDDKYDMIVMGAHTENLLLKRVLGSVSRIVSRLSSKPVIVIPPDSDLKFPKRIVVGLTKELLAENELKYLLDFTSDQEVFIDFAFVTNDDQEFHSLKNIMMDHLEVFDKKFWRFSISAVPHVDNKVNEALIKFAIGQQADLIVVTTHHRTLIESLGHRSVSKKILLKPALPVMVLHSSLKGQPALTDYLYDMIKEG